MYQTARQSAVFMSARAVRVVSCPVQTKDAVILNEETGSESAVKLAALLSEAKII